MAQPEVAAGLDEAVVDGHRLLCRYVKLVAELAEIGDPDAQHPGEPDVDEAGRPVGKGLVTDIRAGHLREQRTRARPLDSEQGVARGDVRGEGAGVACAELTP